MATATAGPSVTEGMAREWPRRVLVVASWYPAHDDPGRGSFVAHQVRALRDVSEKLLREHRKGIVERQFQQKRLAAAVSDIFAQVALLSRVSSILEEQGVEVSGQELYIADTFCARAARRVEASLAQVESNDDERMTAIAKLALRRGSYGYALFED